MNPKINHNKKGMELSMNMIIVAVLALLVLLILAVMLINGAGNWNKGTDCENQGGACVVLNGKSCSEIDSSKPVIGAWSCKQSGAVCCTSVGFS
jgi:hypothetical protein